MPHKAGSKAAGYTATEFNDLCIVHTQTLTVEGPVVLMSQHYFHMVGEANAAAAISVGVALQGMNTLPVAANLSVSQRVLLGNTTLETGEVDYLLSASEVNLDSCSFRPSVSSLLWDLLE